MKLLHLLSVSCIAEFVSAGIVPPTRLEIRNLDGDTYDPFISGQYYGRWKSRNSEEHTEMSPFQLNFRMNTDNFETHPDGYYLVHGWNLDTWMES